MKSFVDLLYDMGVPENSMICSSITEIGVPVKDDIYEYLRNLLDSEQVIPNVPIHFISLNLFNKSISLSFPIFLFFYVKKITHLLSELI